MFNFQDKKIYSQILMHSCAQKNDVSLAKKFQKHLSKEHLKHGVIDQGNKGKEIVKENGHTENIMFRIIMMLHTKMRKCIVIQNNYQHYHFVVHIQSLM